ncbi:unnamed protein product [Gemmata massiliana]|uniref:Uncharacterized protein n=1 Tax=Gemmata massiliana TaxID=1210884 RepID=A0A6P2DLX7_9BACT|nr:hypothetical protein [Gemmata massiliana]VTS03518.1 unnamed protein product [Gemmata massiliana]
MEYLLGQQTRDRLMRLLGNQGAVATLRAGPPRPAPAPWVLVRCTSATPVGGDAVRAQCYPAKILPLASNAVAAVTERAECLLTLLGANGASVKPTAGRVYSALLTGEVESDSKRRPRAFAAKGDGAGSGSGGDSGDCCGTNWTRTIKNGDYFTIALDGGPAGAMFDSIAINGVTYHIRFNWDKEEMYLDTVLPSGTTLIGKKECGCCPCITFGFVREELFPDDDVSDDICDRVYKIQVCVGCPAGWYCIRDAGTTDAPTAVFMDLNEACNDDEIEVVSGPWQTENVAVSHCAGTAVGGDCSTTRSDLEEGVWYNFSAPAGGAGLALIQQLTDPPYVLEAACDSNPEYGANMGVVYTNCTEDFYPPAYGPGVFGGDKDTGAVSGHRCISLPTGGTVKINFGAALTIPVSIQFRLRKVATPGCPDNGTHTITPCGGITSMKVQDRIAIEFITGSSGAYLADVGKWVYLDYDSGSGTWKNPSASFGGYTGAVELNYSSCVTFVQIPGGPSAQGVYSIGGVDYCDATLTRNRLRNAAGDFGWFHVRGQLEWEG